MMASTDETCVTPFFADFFNHPSVTLFPPSLEGCYHDFLPERMQFFFAQGTKYAINV